jgi:hypothetical protein
MFIAKVDGDTVLEVADYRAMFPDTSFTSSGPDAEWLAENSCMPVTVWLPYDPATQVLDATDPYIMEGTVYTVEVRDMTPEEQEAYNNSLKAQNKAQAASLLAATDWVDIPAVINPENIPHLENKSEFDDYRLALRGIAVTPPVTVDPWPVKPEEVWVTE